MSLREAPGLDTLERWMQAVIMHPGGAADGLRSRAAKRLIPAAARYPQSIVLPSKSLSSVERLDLYAYMYYARLLEVMVAEYPVTRQVLGREAFTRIAREFLARHPSRSRTLNVLSAEFPGFLARHLRHRHRAGFAADVARIERAMEDVFDAPLAKPLSAGEFAAIRAPEWGRVRLVVNPALRLLALRFPVNDYMNATRTGRHPRIPRARRTFAVVYRRAFQVFRRDQEPAQWRLLAALAAGRTLAQAVRAAVRKRRMSPDRLADMLGRWFREWAAAGLFVGVARD
ncbi:MAG TPA: DNA-binding domain-containing protein [Steroidobacteraceae bacterium]|nr:DNA-binding domain-containing protein [Steroidobacteraceae bacterium]